jgi:HSP20 family protein
MALMRYRRRLQDWDPLADLMNLADAFGGRMLDLPRFFDGPTSQSTIWHPAVDMYEEDDHMVVKLDLPGLKKDDIDISFDGHVLSITGKREEEKMKGDGRYWSDERFKGEFHRYVHIPMEVSSENLSATVKDGVLEVKLPKTEKNKIKKIPIESGKANK